ncbi:hypothetical protein [Nonomuraea pusilla]|uniref:Uncharacterized protein n=1 Tax=Nonomuraea pusilla TaxID=46177 RepID=A0A1H7ING4_9ACTN|nr:hypothetical protein [Nonomuraea pusilla]SEK63100.1 hypothetical protein SAMN05660976_00844 [Nonomuraea pusilla]
MPDELSDDDKRAPVALIIDCASEETDNRQLTAWEMSENLGLIA